MYKEISARFVIDLNALVAVSAAWPYRIAATAPSAPADGALAAATAGLAQAQHRGPGGGQRRKDDAQDFNREGGPTMTTNIAALAAILACADLDFLEAPPKKTAGYGVGTVPGPGNPDQLRRFCRT